MCRLDYIGGIKLAITYIHETDTHRGEAHRQRLRLLVPLVMQLGQGHRGFHKALHRDLAICRQHSQNVDALPSSRGLTPPHQGEETRGNGVNPIGQAQE